MSAALAETPGIPESSVSTIPGGKQNPSNRPPVRDLLPVPLRWLLKLVNASNTKRATAGSAKNVTVSLAANSPATTSSPSIWLPTSQLSLVAKSAVQTTQSVVSFACIQISSLFVVTNVTYDHVTLKYYVLVSACLRERFIGHDSNTVYLAMVYRRSEQKQRCTLR